MVEVLLPLNTAGNFAQVAVLRSGTYPTVTIQKLQGTRDTLGPERQGTTFVCLWSHIHPPARPFVLLPQRYDIWLLGGHRSLLFCLPLAVSPPP